MSALRYRASSRLACIWDMFLKFFVCFRFLNPHFIILGHKPTLTPYRLFFSERCVFCIALTIFIGALKKGPTRLRNPQTGLRLLIVSREYLCVGIHSSIPV